MTTVLLCLILILLVWVFIPLALKFWGVVAFVLLVVNSTINPKD